MASFSTGRLALALGASVMLHAITLAALERLPSGVQPGVWSTSHAGERALQARLRESASGYAMPGELSDTAGPLAEVESRGAGDPAPEVETSDAGANAVASPPPLAESGNAPVPALALVPPLKTYTPVTELDQRPLIAVHVEPEFPPDVSAQAGRVVLRLYIGEDGLVDEVAVRSSEPPGLFDAAAIKAFSAAKFIPGVKRGAAVPSLLTIEVFFGAPVPLSQSGR